MTRIEVDEATVRRLYPLIMEAIEGAEMDNAGCALCAALVTIAYKNGYSYRGLRYLALGAIRGGWIELKKHGMPAWEASFHHHVNGEEKDEQ